MSAQTTDETWPGERLGLPRDGIGAAGRLGTRIAAFVIDVLLAAGLAWVFTAPEPPQNWSLLVWAAMTAVMVGLFGFTPGQLILGIRVAPLGRTFVGLWAIPRTVLTFLVIPPLISDQDGRGWHDRLCRTVVVRMR